MTGASTADLGELRANRSRAALISGVTNMAGLGLGALLGGVAAQLPPAAAVFASFAILGLIAALTGNFLSGSLYVHNHALAGASILLAFGAASLAQPLSVHIEARLGLIVGMTLLPCGAVLIVAAMAATSPPVFLAGAAFGEVVSAYFASACLGSRCPLSELASSRSAYRCSPLHAYSPPLSRVSSRPALRAQHDVLKPSPGPRQL